MCGVVGYIDFRQNTSREVLLQMVESLHHRGPDDQGLSEWKENKYQVGLGHTRLSIIDLSKAGHQPMNFEYWSIVYNGEIYNYQEIKNELIRLGHQFKTQSDTEVILHAYAEWGKSAVTRFIGMFVIVLYDRKQQEIIFFRDRAGVKPLYIYWDQELLLFASELKAFHHHPSFTKEIDKEALVRYIQYGYVPTPLSIFKNVFKPYPGTWYVFELTDKIIRRGKYWDIKDFYYKSKLPIDYTEAKDQVHDLMKSSFKYRMVADVPVGVFLSGGYDSTAVTSILQTDLTEKLKTFTIGFEEGNNEAPFAKKIASYLQTDHTEYICTTKEAQSIIPKIPHYYDEPFGDSSAIPTTLVSRIAREKVTVALSADGGDEIFGGYNHHEQVISYYKKLQQIPSGLIPLIKAISKGGYLLLGDQQSALKYKVQALSNSLQQNSTSLLSDLYAALEASPAHITSKCFSFNLNEWKYPIKVEADTFKQKLDSILSRDYQMYLQNDILTKVDRATMSVSLEGREPLIDHRIAEFTARLPEEFKIKPPIKKRILRDIVHQYIPSEIMDRPKSGFTIPIYNWLRKDLCYLLDEYCNKESLQEPGFWNVTYCLKQIHHFKKGKFHYLPFIWYLLVFQMWYKKWM